MEYRIVCISGGVGKTQLMLNFAEYIEARGHVPGGVFWVTGEGDTDAIVDSLNYRTRRFLTCIGRKKDSYLILRITSSTNLSPWRVFFKV